MEKAVTLQLGTLLTALNELVQTALPPGACTDALLRELSRTYAILTTLIKYVSATPSNTQAYQNIILGYFNYRNPENKWRNSKTLK